jgi:PAS domain S-box-containing protein
VQQRAAELTRSETRFQALVETTAQIVWTTDARGRVVDDSPSWRAFTGQTREQWLNTRWAEAVHTEDLAQVTERWQRALTDGTPVYMEFRLRHAGGGYRWVAARGVPLRQPDGVIYGWIGSNVDITARKQAEAALRDNESQRLLSSVVEHSADAILTLSPAGLITSWNRGAARMYGYAAADVIGRHISLLVPQDQAGEESNILARIAGGERLEQHETKRRRKDGRIIDVSLTYSPIRDAHGEVTAFAKIARDITERKAREAELAAAHAAVTASAAQLRALAEELRRSNRELEDFARVASHDLQEPLRKVQAFGDLLVGRFGDRLEDEGRDYLRRMQDAARRMSTLITDLLAFSRVGTRGQPFIPVDLAAVAREVVSDLEARIAESGGRVELGELRVLPADRLQMHQLLQNLIGNALKYRRPDVAPVVRVYGETLDGGEAFRLFIVDNGIGFDMKYLDRIFLVFQRLHGRLEYEGTGIGLAICKKIVERHGGQITAQSAPQAGATFIVTLPTRQAGAAST